MFNSTLLSRLLGTEIGTFMERGKPEVPDIRGATLISKLSALIYASHARILFLVVVARSTIDDYNASLPFI